MGQFEDLSQNASWRDEFWDEVKDKMKALLDELNSDVFNGRGYIKDNHRCQGDTSADNALLLPNIALCTRHQTLPPFLGLGVGREKRTIRIFAYASFRHFQWIDLSHFDVAIGLKEYAKWWLDRITVDF